MIPTLFLYLLNFPKFIAPANVDHDEWTRIDKELKTNLSSVHSQTSCSANPVEIQSLGDQISTITHTLLTKYKDLLEYVAPSHTTFTKHSNKTLNQLETLKKTEERSF